MKEEKKMNFLTTIILASTFLYQLTSAPAPEETVTLFSQVTDQLVEEWNTAEHTSPTIHAFDLAQDYMTQSAEKL
jgi:hypothetical protein